MPITGVKISATGQNNKGGPINSQDKYTVSMGSCRLQGGNYKQIGMYDKI